MDRDVVEAALVSVGHVNISEVLVLPDLPARRASKSTGMPVVRFNTRIDSFPADGSGYISNIVGSFC